MRGWLALLDERFEQAADAVGGVEERHLKIGGIPVRFACAGSATAPLLAPFEHLSTAALDTRLEVRLFDSASTGASMPDLPWPVPDDLPGVAPFARFVVGDVCVVSDLVGGPAIVVDSARSRAVFHTPDADAVGLHEQAALLRDALQMLLAPRRWLVHAAAVGNRESASLLVGASGSGKSTLALSCAQAGMEIAGDDYIVLEPGQNPRAHALSSMAKLSLATARLLGIDPVRTAAWRFHSTLEGPAKAVVGIEEVAPGRLSAELPITTLVAPRLSDRREPRLVEVSAPVALRALAPSTALQSRVAPPRLLASLGDLVRRVRSFELELCEDVAANAEAVAEAVDRGA